MSGEQRSAGNGEILFAALAAEAEHTVRAAGFVSFNRTAGRATRGAVGICPADRLEGCLGFARGRRSGFILPSNKLVGTFERREMGRQTRGRRGSRR